MNQEKLTFKNNLNQKISARIHFQDQKSKKGLIFSHGLFSTKDGYKIKKLAEQIVNCGFTLMTFDFSFSGESEGQISDISILQEVNDLKSAVDFFYDYGIEEIHLMGSSMGGFVSLLFLTQHDYDIKSLITIATPIDLYNLFEDNIGHIKISELTDDGFTDVHGVKVKNTFFKEIDKINIDSLIGNIKIPILIIHGSDDAVVSISNVDKLKELLGNNPDVNPVIIEKGDHSLTSEDNLEIIENELTKWLTKYR